MATKVGIIGAGGMLQYHAGGFRAGGADIVAICDVNEAAAGNPALLNQDPQGEGWLVRLKASDLSASSELMNQAAYDENYPVT